MKAEKEHVRYIVAFWADLDIGAEGHEEKNKYFEGPREAAKAIRSFPRAPSIIVESGRGAHLYWLLREVTEVTEPERFETILRKINDFLQCDTDVNLDTVLRLPETVNTKVPSRNVNCEVKFINTNFRYALQDFENLGHRVSAPVPGSAATQARRAGPPGTPSFGEEEPAKMPIAAVGGPDTGVAESLVLDEAIIDELIDDISMTGVVTGATTEPTASRSVSSGEMPPQFDSGPSVRREVVSSVTPVVSRAAPTTSFLEHIFSTRTEVEVSLVSSDMKIHGVLTWNRDGLIGVESGDDFFTIPLSSISYIKTKIR